MASSDARLGGPAASGLAGRQRRSGSNLSLNRAAERGRGDGPRATEPPRRLERLSHTRWAALLLPLAGLLLAGVWSWLDTTGQLRQSVGRELALLRAQTLRTLDVQESVIAAVDVAVANLSWPQIRASRSTHALLSHLADAADAVDTVGLVAPDGRVADASDMPWPARPIDLSDRDFVRAFPPGSPAGGHAFLGQAVLSRVDGRPQVHLARPRIAAGDSVGDGGVVVAGFRPALLEDLFAQVAGRHRAKVLLMRGDGSLLARYPQRLQPGDLAPLPPQDPARIAAASLPASDAPVFAPGGLAASERIRAYGLVLSLRLEPAEAMLAWLRQMLFPGLGAAAAAALLQLLAQRDRASLRAEAERLRLRTERAEAAQLAAQERARMEARLRQVERQAAVGQLAAGVAHDFANLLQTVTAGAEGLQRTPDNAARVANSAQVILRAAERGMALTRRMLDLARSDEPPEGHAALERFSPEAALRGAAGLLAHMLGQPWPVRIVLPPQGVPMACGAEGECEAVLLNLASNACDAMPEGGAIILRAALAEPPAALGPGAAGVFVRIDVQDSGTGMDAVTLARAGEAFFTTKPRGSGTGLGLSMARSFAQRSGGLLTIDSRLQAGTTVTLWLPAD